MKGLKELGDFKETMVKRETFKCVLQILIEAIHDVAFSHL